MDLLSDRFENITNTTSQAVLETYRTDPDFFGIGADNKKGHYLHGRIRDENSAFHDQMKTKRYNEEYAVAPDDTPMGRQVPPFLIRDSRNGASGQFRSIQDHTIISPLF